jgi:adenylosuccinate synthase
MGFGDEGKGTITDALVHRHHSPLVVRFNGGCQAAHAVVANDKEHVFSQFGSGTLAGAATLLSHYMLIDPLALRREADALRTACGFLNPYELLLIDRHAPLVTPYHVAATRARELARGVSRHGSTGRGIGEAQADLEVNPASIPVAGDIHQPQRLAEKLAAIRTVNLAKVDPQVWVELDLDCCPRRLAECYVEELRRATILDEKDVLRSWHVAPLVMEGAQGALLDQHHGFFPYVTRSTTTDQNARDLLADTNLEPHVVGVLRAYMTRHGPGPFPTEYRGLEFAEHHNTEFTWQGHMRLGYSDFVLHRYAHSVVRPDCYAITHLDRLTRKFCTTYSSGAHEVPRGLLSTRRCQWLEIQNAVLQPYAGPFDDLVMGILGAPTLVRSYGAQRSAKVF